MTVNDTPAYQKWADEDVRWIMTPEERAAFFRLLTVEQKEQFIEQFWVRRDPTPNTLENEFKDEHYRRIAYANVHFGAGSTPGWESDRGRAYIAYGPPDEIENHYASAAANQSGSGGESAGSPYQVWRYRRYQSAPAVDENGRTWRQNGHELIFRFVDDCKCGEYRNTSGWPPLYEQAPAPPGVTVAVKAVNSPQVRFKELEQIASHKIWLNQVPFQI
ncbi:MAG TPA: GWxTD domain-containing protein, partial [Terriglobales bacterium]|nr:GWxTD domain-containing protein [Terriglobales bacterium]